MKEASKGANDSKELIYSLDGKPPTRVALPLGLQHVLTMFVGNLAPVLIITGVISVTTGDVIITPAQKVLMIQCAMFVSGLATLLQLYPIKLGPIQIGGRLPIVMGTSFVFVGALAAIGAQYGAHVMFGAILVGALAEILLGLFYRPLSRLFPPVVIGCVLLAIGLSLLPVGVQYLAGGAAAQTAAEEAAVLITAGVAVPADLAAQAAQYGSWQNISVGILVVLIVLAFQRWGKGFTKAIAILVAVIVGYVVAALLGLVDFSAVTSAVPVSLPIPAFVPEFRLEPIITIGLLYIISGLETMGNVNGITAAAFNRPASTREVSGAILADSIGSIVAGIFNTLPNTAFGQNAGIVAMTKVVNRWCVAMGAFVLILAGFFPPIGALFSAMPPCVLGGAVVTVFGMIIVNGMKLIFVDGLSERNILIVCITYGIGFGISQASSLVALFPEFVRFIFSETTLAVCLVAVLAHLVFGEKSSANKAEGNPSLGEAEKLVMPVGEGELL
jgi:NCS2 family nucleobase:cation symporter-2